MDVVAFEGFDYDPNTVEDEMFLSQAPLSLMKENIRSQFDEPGENRKNDFVQIFLNKYIYSKMNELEDEEEDVDELHDDFISFMEDLFKEYLELGIPDLENKDNSSQEELIHYIYRFFIINIKRNFTKFLINYIEDNKDKLVEVLETTKNVTYLSYKKIIPDETDLEILTNLSTVIGNIFCEDITVPEFLEYAKSDSANLEIEFMIDKYKNCEVTGNFVNKYIEMLVKDSTLAIEIECKVKNKLLKKYTKD